MEYADHNLCSVSCLDLQNSVAWVWLTRKNFCSITREIAFTCGISISAFIPHSPEMQLYSDMPERMSERDVCGFGTDSTGLH